MRPVRQARSGMLGRPPVGGSGGSSGLTIAQSVPGRSGVPMPTVYHTITRF